MKTHDFTLIFSLPDPQGDPELALPALAKCDCNDALIGIGRLGRLALNFSRLASSLEEAIASAQNAVVAAVPGAKLIVIDD